MQIITKINEIYLFLRYNTSMKSNKFYEEVESTKMILRDHLAFDRTVMANWRTGFAFFRTSLVALASGLTLVELFQDNSTLIGVGILLIIISPIILITGIIKTASFSKSLSKVYKKKDTE